MKNTKVLYGIITVLTIALITSIVINYNQTTKLKNGKEIAVKVGKTKITADDLYNDLKEKYAMNILIDKIDRTLFDSKYKTDDKEKKQKMRKKNLILSILTVLFANIVYFIWMPYPKGFLKTAGSSTFLFDFITNLIFFAMFVVILLVSVSAVTSPGSILTKSRIPAEIAICIAVQLGFDFLKFAAERLFRLWAILSNDFLTVWGLFVYVLIIVKLLKVKSVRWKRFYAVFIPYAMVALTVFFVLDVQDILHVQHASEKYMFDTELAHKANAIAANTQFFYEIRNGILDFLTCAVIMIALCFSSVSVHAVDKEEYHTKEAHFVTRIAAILLLSFAVCGAKVLILPYNAMNRMQFPSLSARGEGFNITQKETIVWRTNNS